MTPPRVLTDVGLITAAGDTVAAVFDRLLDGKALGGTTTVKPGAGSTFPAVPIADFNVKDHVKRRGLKTVSRASQLACAAASRLADGLAGVAPSDVGVVFGTAWASMDSIVRFEWEAQVEGPRFVDPILFTETVANVPAGQVSIFFGWSALNATISAGTSSGLEALIRAATFLEEGRARAVVAGGGDELNRHMLNARHAEPVPAGGRPVGGEAACLFVIESASDAVLRGSRIHARLGAGASRVVADDGEPGLDSRVDLLRDLLERDGLSPADLDLLVLSGNGDAARGELEAAVLSRLFGTELPLGIAPKAIVGETWGASGPLAVAVALEAMRRSLVPARPRSIPARPGRAAGLFPDEPRELAIRHALVIDCTPASHFSGLLLHAER